MRQVDCVLFPAAALPSAASTISTVAAAPLTWRFSLLLPSPYQMHSSCVYTAVDDGGGRAAHVTPELEELQMPVFVAGIDKLVFEPRCPLLLRRLSIHSNTLQIIVLWHVASTNGFITQSNCCDDTAGGMHAC